MIKKLLIANRGEIACRIARTASRMGIDTLAVASASDAEACHVSVCDDVFYLDGNTPSESYLRGVDIIQAALLRGADAVHPGYGFLSEDPDFAQAVEEAGLIWVGPSSTAIRAMGLKDAAKVLMEKAQVPVVPGYHEEAQSPDILRAAASEIGYPVLIKAVAGGGGKGMRLVTNDGEFSEHLASAQSEARASFGNDRVLIEKFVSNPRHIEIQVFGDGTSAVYLYERDCSLQRRYQKVVEEAPAPAMPQDMREAMGQAAVRAAEAIGYASAGTVEFIVDGSCPLRFDNFYFMEMNTRLQVEHPVTEEILGIDLVEWQLRVAAGHVLPKLQDEISAQGHSIEVRLYAEDPQVDFLPSTGCLSRLEFGPGLRVETGVRVGDNISPFYDPMIAKLISSGIDRGQARAKLLRGLRQTFIAGVKTNRDFLIALLEHQDFASGSFDTGLIARDLAQLTHLDAPSSRDWAVAAILALGLPREDIDTAYQGFSNFSPLQHSVLIRWQDTENLVQVSISGHCASVKVQSEILELKANKQSWFLEGSDGVTGFKDGQHIYVYGKSTYIFEAPNPLDRSSTVKSDGAILAPMPGLVKNVFVELGQQVAQGDAILVLEAMKMQHTLRAVEGGSVRELSIEADDQVKAGQVLALIKSDEISI